MKDRIIVIAFVVLLVSLFASSSIAENNKTERILRFTPSLGWLAKNSSYTDPILARMGINKQLDAFDRILLDLDLDVELHHKWFATGSFIYSHMFYNDPVSGGVDLFGLPFGIKYLLLERESGRLRLWAGGFAGPYLKNESITLDIGGRNTHGSSTDLAFGFGAHTGLDYFFGPYIGVGVQAKVQYLLFEDNIMILSGGPSLMGRF